MPTFPSTTRNRRLPRGPGARLRNAGQAFLGGPGVALRDLQPVQQDARALAENRFVNDWTQQLQGAGPIGAEDVRQWAAQRRRHGTLPGPGGAAVQGPRGLALQASPMPAEPGAMSPMEAAHARDNMRAAALHRAGIGFERTPSAQAQAQALWSAGLPVGPGTIVQGPQPAAQGQQAAGEVPMPAAPLRGAALGAALNPQQIPQPALSIPGGVEAMRREELNQGAEQFLGPFAAGLRRIGATQAHPSRFDAVGPRGIAPKVYEVGIGDDRAARISAYADQLRAAHTALAGGNEALYSKMHPGAMTNPKAIEGRDEEFAAAREGMRERRAARAARSAVPDDLRQMLLASKRTGMLPERLAATQVAGAIGRGDELTPDQQAMAFGPEGPQAQRLAAAAAVGAGAGQGGLPVPGFVEDIVRNEREAAPAAGTPLGNIMAQLPARDAGRFRQLMDAGDMDAVEQFLRLRGINAAPLLEAAEQPGLIGQTPLGQARRIANLPGRGKQFAFDMPAAATLGGTGLKGIDLLRRMGWLPQKRAAGR